MTHHAVMGGVLLAILLVPVAGAEDSANAAPERNDDVIVRPVRDVGAIERVTIALTRAFVPGAKVFSPLYAYAREIACSEDGGPRETFLKHRGPAALVYDDNGVIRARYHQTTALALKDAESNGWCDSDSVPTWSIATTSPLESAEIAEEERYLSRDVERIDQQLEAQRP